MDVIEMMKNAGFTPSVVTEGEWQPYEGVYKVSLTNFEVKDTKKDGTPCNKYGLAEFKIIETLKGREPREGTTRPEFSRFITLTGEEKQVLNKKKGLPFLVNAIFTADGTDVMGSNEDETYQNIQNKIGLEFFVNAFKGKTWKYVGDDESGKAQYEEDKEAPAKQDFSIIKEAVALRKAQA